MSTPNKNKPQPQPSSPSQDINNNDVHLNTSRSVPQQQQQQQQQPYGGFKKYQQQQQPQQQQLNSPQAQPQQPQQPQQYTSPNRQPQQNYIPQQPGAPYYPQQQYQPNFYSGHQPQQGSGFGQPPYQPPSPTQQQPQPQPSSPSNQQSPSSPNQQQQQQQNANKNKIKPSVNIVSIPPRTHSAPLPNSSEEQHPKGFTPDKRAPTYNIPQHGYFKPMYGAPPQQHIFYPQPPPQPYFYQPPIHVNNAPPPQIPQPTKKALDIVDPNTNEKVIISSPPKGSTSSNSTSNGPAAVTPSPGTNSNAASSSNTNSPTATTTTPTLSNPSAPTTPIKAKSFSSGNVNLRKKAEEANKSSTATTPTTTSTSTSTNLDSTNTTPTKAESTTEADQSSTTETKVVDQTPSSSSSSTTTANVDDTKTSVAVEEPAKPSATIEQPIESNVTVEEPVKPTANVEEPIKTTTEEQSIKSEAIKSQEPVKANDESSTPSNNDTNEKSTEKVEEELEEWEKKGEEDFNLPPNNNESTSTTASGTSIPFIRNSGEKIVYSKEEMMSLKPKSIEEPSGPLKDLKNQIETNVMQGGQLNRSGNKINPANAKMNMNMNMNQPNYPPQNNMNMNMKYPPQMNMNMKYPPKNYPGQPGQQQFKYPAGYQYQQQIQGNQPQQMHQQMQKSYGSDVSTTREPVQPPISQIVNEKRWVPTKVNALNESEKILRRAKSILNKITPEKFATLSEELLSLGVIEDEIVHRGTIEIIFDKALNESKFCAMYTDLCKKIFENEKQKKDQIRKTVFEKYNPIEMENYNRLTPKEKDEFDTKNNIKPTFRTFLLSACQKEYEKIKFDEVDKVPEDIKPEDKTDFEEKQFKERKRIFGLIKFIGELFKQSMLSEKIVHAIMISLIGELNKPSEIKLECFCKLLSIVGKTLSQNEQANSYLTQYFQRMQQLVESPLSTLSQRIRFLIQNVIDLKNNNWVAKTDDSAKTLKEVESSINSNKPDQNDSRKSLTGVKSSATMNKMFSVAFNNHQFMQPPKTGSSPGGMGGPPPPQQTFNKGPAGFKPAAGFQPPNKYGNYPQSNQFNSSGFNMGGPMGNMNKYGQQQQHHPQQHHGVNQQQQPQQHNQQHQGSSSTSASSTVSADLQKKWDAAKKSVLETISEFLELGDDEEFVESIKQYVPAADLYPQVISQIVTNACDGRNEDTLRDLVINLVNDKKFFTQVQAKAGIELFISNLSDLFEDRPSAYKAVARILYSFYENEIVSNVSQITTPLSKQLDVCGSIISKIILEFVIQFNDPKKAASIFIENKINIQSLISDSNISEFVINYNQDLELFINEVLNQ